MHIVRGGSMLLLACVYMECMQHSRDGWRCGVPLQDDGAGEAEQVHPVAPAGPPRGGAEGPDQGSM